jgi:hypothetical protein
VADTAAPKRKIFIKLFEHAIERTEDEIAELKAGGLFVKDAPADAPLAPHAQAQPAARVPALQGAPAGGTDGKPKE